MTDSWSNSDSRDWTKSIYTITSQAYQKRKGQFVKIFSFSYIPSNIFHHLNPILSVSQTFLSMVHIKAHCTENYVLASLSVDAFYSSFWLKLIFTQAKVFIS